MTAWKRTILGSTLMIALWPFGHHAQPAQVRTGHIETGISKFYSSGIMQRVARVRHMTLSQRVSGYAAVADCSRIGQIVWASLNGHRWQSFQVIDCSQTRDLARHRAEGLVIEVDFQSAVRNGFSRRGLAPATVWFPPAERR